MGSSPASFESAQLLQAPLHRITAVEEGVERFHASRVADKRHTLRTPHDNETAQALAKRAASALLARCDTPRLTPSQRYSE
jgi:RPA family protein